MGKYKNILVILILCTLLLCMLSACAKSEESLYEYKGSIAPYLHEIAYKDYIFDSEGKTYKIDSLPACSVVRNGNYVGRNFDYFYDEVPSIVVHMEATTGRYASIGLSCPSNICEKDLLSGNVSEEDFLLIPNMMTEGINEKGVFVCFNVVSDEGVIMTETNPGKEDLCIWFVVREILNKAASADEAIEILNDRNVYGRFYEYENFHYFIADKEKTYIVEFIDGKVIAQEKTGSNQIMTNFYCNLPEINEHAEGVERYQILKSNYANSSTFTGMQDLMKEVKFSEAYNPDADPLRLSDIGLYTQSQIQNEDITEEALGYIKEFHDEFENMYANNLRPEPAIDGWWITVTSSIFDLQNRSFSIFVQEDFEHEYTFSLN